MRRCTLIERRSFLCRAVTMATTFFFPGFLAPLGLSATKQGYKLPPESVLPNDIRQAPVEVREAYRFAIANRESLRYIPCYCGCGHEGHTSNYSCYLKDDSKPGDLVFDRMSLN